MITKRKRLIKLGDLPLRPDLNISHTRRLTLRILSLTPCFSGVFRAERRRKTVFNGFYDPSQTAEAVRTPSSHSYTPLKQGVKEGTRSEWAMFAKHSG